LAKHTVEPLTMAQRTLGAFRSPCQQELAATPGSSRTTTGRTLDEPFPTHAAGRSYQCTPPVWARTSDCIPRRSSYRGQTPLANLDDTKEYLRHEWPTAARQADKDKADVEKHIADCQALLEKQKTGDQADGPRVGAGPATDGIHSAAGASAQAAKQSSRGSGLRIAVPSRRRLALGPRWPA
jgi:hypothetical protein